MIHRVSRFCSYACALLLAQGTLSACADGDPVAAADEQETGQVNFALTGGSISGQLYRLRNGTVEVTGSSETTVSTEDYLDQNTIELDMPAGGYLARLLTGWELERSVGDGWEPVSARLISTNPLPFEIIDQQLTNVLLRFQAGDQVIEFGNGRLSVSIFVEDTDSPPPPDSNCSDACIEAEPLACLNQDFCLSICQQLPDLLADPTCSPEAQAYVDCAAEEPGSAYECYQDYPLATACLAEFQLVIDCVTGPCTDLDGDGFCAESGDCNDADPSISPGQPELCDDGIDNNCDGAVDGDDPSCAELPEGWTCLAQFFGTSDGCDCGCGVVDPDCADASVASCEFCDETGSCSTEPGCPGTIDETNNAICQ